MLRNLAKRACTRRAAASLAFASPLSAVHVPKQFYATRVNEGILKLLRECEEEEETSTKNKFKIRSFRTAAAAIEKLDFRVQHSDQLKDVEGVGPGIRSRIDAFFGGKRPSRLPTDPEQLRRRTALNTLLAIPGLGKQTAEALYDDGCHTIAQLRLKKYKETLTPAVKRTLKYFEHLQRPLPREVAETMADFCKHILQTDGYEIVIAGEYRRNSTTLSGPIELLIIDKNAVDPVLAPPHPSTLKIPGSQIPTRKKLPFVQHYVKDEQRGKSVLLNKIIWPLKNESVVSDTITQGLNVWQGWVRVPKKGESWESSRERFDGIRNLSGDFHKLIITYIPEKSRGAALLALTGDGHFHYDCVRKAIKAGLYLNERGLWEWEPDSQSLARFKTSDAPHKITSLGAIWGSETEEDKGRWIQLDAFEEEQIFESIGAEYVPPEKRNLRFISGEARSKLSAATADP